jgi:hypothetical protein
MSAKSSQVVFQFKGGRCSPLFDSLYLITRTHVILHLLNYRFEAIEPLMMVAPKYPSELTSFLADVLHP